MQTYDVGNIVLMVQRGNVINPMNINMSFTIDMDYLVPTEDEESTEEYHTNISRSVMFLQGINNALVVETSSNLTEPLLIGEIGNINIEVPNGCSSPPLIGIILFRKLNALMKGYPVENMSMSFDLVDSSQGSFNSSLTFHKAKTGRLEQIFNAYEKSWEELLNNPEEVESSEEVPEGGHVAWWNRCDGNVRDFIDVSQEVLEAGNLKILTVDIGSEEESMGSHYNKDDDNNPPTDDDGYTSF